MAKRACAEYDVVWNGKRYSVVERLRLRQKSQMTLSTAIKVAK